MNILVISTGSSERSILSCRQGDIYTYHNHNYIVISHDCDIAVSLDKEPNIEVIEINLLPDSNDNNNFLYGKNPREIRLETIDNNSYIQITQNLKQSFSKEEFINATKSQSIVLTKDSKIALVSWLSARYQRHAFPDELSRRLHVIQREIEKIGRRNPLKGVPSLLINYAPADEELDEGDPYEISLIILYDQEYEGAEQNALILFQKLSKFNGQINDDLCIEIKVKNYTEFTLQDYTKYVEWRFEYISLRGEAKGL